MNPWHLNASELMIWGLVAHLIADWPLQNEWMALNKMKRGRRVHAYHEGNCLECGYRWHDPSTHHRCREVRGPIGIIWRHPAAYTHALIHYALLYIVFGWVAGYLAIAHLIIDCRWPVAKWSQFIKQTQPQGTAMSRTQRTEDGSATWSIPVVDIGLEVRFWNDQVFHIICIAVAALIVGSV
jgi:hypothetical protein